MAEMRDINNIDINTISIENRKMIGNNWYGVKYTKILIEDLAQHKVELYCMPIGLCAYFVQKQSFLVEISFLKVLSCSIIMSFMKDRWYDLS